MFSSRRPSLVVPGIGTMSSPCASTHASASCAGWFAPAGTDAGKVQEIALAAQAAWNSEPLSQFVKKSLLTPQLVTGEALQARIAQETAFYQKRVASLNLTMME